MSGSRMAVGPSGLPPPPPPPPPAADKNAYKEKQKTAIAVRKVRWEEQFPLHFYAMAGDAAALERSLPLHNPSHLHHTRANQADNDTWTPGHYACFYGHAGFLAGLLLRGASPHASNLNKCTLLHFAAGRGNMRCVLVLLEAGANANVKDDDRMTPFLRCEELKPDGWERISLVIRMCRFLRPCRGVDGKVVMLACSELRVADQTPR